MKVIRLKKYQFNNKSFVALVDDFDCPFDPFVSAYLSTLASQSFNTQLRKAVELSFVLKYFACKGIDLATRMATEQLVSEGEYLQFYDACCLQKNSLDSSNVMFFRKISDKALRNIITANQKTLSKVSNETLQGRIRRFREYCTWLFDHFHEFLSVDEAISKRFHRLTSKIKLDEEGIGRNRSQRVADPIESVIPDEVFTRLLEMILPSSPNNPFTGSKVRNYLIVSVLYQSGIRRGALAKLKISDCHFSGSYDQISIYRSGGDPTDPRLDKPNQKTKAHLATIPPILMRQIKLYIDQIRVNIPQQQSHDFIFISEKNSRATLGQPISLKSINSIFQKLSDALQFHIHPHMLRHKWNEIFDEAGEMQGVDHKLLEDIRKYAMGWTGSSIMSRIYNDKRLAKKAKEISLAHQKRVDSQ
nr:site-specific integrase [uncultured Deefgea sp.]